MQSPFACGRNIALHTYDKPQSNRGHGSARTDFDIETCAAARSRRISSAWERSIYSPGYRSVTEPIRKANGSRLRAAACKALRFTAVALVLASSRAATASGVHWAFKPPVRPAIPATKSVYRNPVDQFLVADLRRAHLAFSSPADRRTILRRVTFDLIGLPPTSAEMDAYLADRSPNAYEKVVDRLLADPRFGEKWARHWLDTAGYADSEGILQEDRVRPNAWRYRDYVIRSINVDKPYDRFLREQIAGDELVDYRGASRWTPLIEESIVATGFLRTAVDATRDDFNPHQFTEYQVRMLNDTQTILVSSTLGLTLQCARCHDHKFEPLLQRDYYRMQAFLAGAIRPDGALLPTNRRQIPAATDAEQKSASEINDAVGRALQQLSNRETTLIADFRQRRLDSHPADVAEADRVVLAQAAATAEARRTAEEKALVTKYKSQIEASPELLSTAFPEFSTRYAEIKKARGNQEKQRVVIDELRALYDQDASPPKTHVRIRGEWARPGDVVEPGVPTVLDDPRNPFTLPTPPKGAKTTGRRLALAEWITRSDNPLTARVIVNRLWAHHFGVGLVATPENFGRSGAAPSNPALLDWLACSLVQGINGSAPWTLKALHRLIVTSTAYRQDSAFRAEAAGRDPDDRLLWRQRPRRLEAESLRDAILFVAGALDNRMYGEPVAEETRATGEIAPTGEDKQGRRSIYLLVRRSMPVTLLNTFDAPVMETNCTRRSASATAGQALALLNSAFVDAQARSFAERVLRETSVRPAGTAAPPRPPSDQKAGATLPPAHSSSKLDASGSGRAGAANVSVYGAWIDAGYRIALTRLPTRSERATALAFLESQSARYRNNGKPVADADTERRALADLCAALIGSNEFLYLD